MKTLHVFILTLVLVSFSTLVKADNPKKEKKHRGHFSWTKRVYYNCGYYVIDGDPIYDYNMGTRNYSTRSSLRPLTLRFSFEKNL